MPDGALGGAVGEHVAALLQEQVWPSYTMAAERTIHTDVLAECGIGSQRTVVTAAESVPDEADEFLF